MVGKVITLNNGNVYTRVDKRRARELFNIGQRVLIMRNKVNPNYFAPFYSIIGKEFGNKDFDKAVNAYEYYNHEYELGNRTEFYMYERGN